MSTIISCKECGKFIKAEESRYVNYSSVCANCDDSEEVKLGDEVESK